MKLSALDLACIADTLQQSTAVANGQRLFNFTLEARKATLKRIEDGMRDVAIEIERQPSLNNEHQS